MRSGRLAASAVALVLLLGGGGAVPAVAHDTSASRQDQIRDEIAQLKGELDEAAAEEAELVADLRVSRHMKAELDAEVAALDAELSAALATLAAAERSLEATLARQQAAARRLDAARSRLRDAKELLQEQAVAAFTRRGMGADQLSVVLRVKDISELHEARAYMALVARYQAGVVEEFAAIEGDMAAMAADLRTAAAQALEQRNEVEARADEVAVARAAQDAVRDRVAAEVAYEERLVVQIRSRQHAYEQRIATLRRESEEIAALLRRRQSGQTISRCSDGRLGMPLRNGRVTSGYGYRTHPIFGNRRLHTGVDFGATSGTPILAAGGGEVIFAGWKGGYGNAVIVDHGGALATLYAHQSAIAVRAGQEVSEGQVIGRVGSTGYSTGPHLHFEVRVNGTPVDPLGCL